MLILDTGELQVSDKERKHEYDNIFRDAVGGLYKLNPVGPIACESAMLSTLEHKVKKNTCHLNTGFANQHWSPQHWFQAFAFKFNLCRYNAVTVLVDKCVNPETNRPYPHG
jgi:hypothetical protein